MSKTSWGLTPSWPAQRFLFLNGDVYTTPPVEMSGSGRMVRIFRETKSWHARDGDVMLREHAKLEAVSRGTECWVQLPDEANDRAGHGGVSPGLGVPESFEGVSKLYFDRFEADNAYTGSTQVVFEFEAQSGLTAQLWCIIQSEGYGRTRRTPSVHSALTYRAVHSDAPLQYVQFGKYSSDWWTPRRYSATQPPANLPEFINHTCDSQRAAVLDALTMIKSFADLDSIQIPVWRDHEESELMEFKFKRTNFTKALYEEMLEFIQTKPSLDKIKGNFDEITKELSSLGVVLTESKGNSLLTAIEDGSGTDLVCHVLPVTETADDDVTGIAVVEDRAHHVSLDFSTGSVVVTCYHTDGDLLDRWNYERTRAELTGELDAFLGFARQHQKRRAKRKFDRIVEARTKKPLDIDFNANA